MNLQVLWLKALAGDDAAYALLPRGARLLVAPPLRRFYPRLHHQNINLRAKFLDDAVRDELRRGDDDVAVVALGAGFDGRAARAVEGRGPRARAADVDLPEVIAQKRGVLDSTYGAELIACDLAGAGVEAALARAIANRTRVVFVVEALLIYLDAAAAERLLDACRSAPCAAVSLCFADRLAIDGVDITEGVSLVGQVLGGHPQNVNACYIAQAGGTERVHALTGHADPDVAAKAGAIVETLMLNSMDSFFTEGFAAIAEEQD